MKRLTAGVALMAVVGLAGCADLPTSSSATSSPTETSYSYPSSSISPILKYSNHLGPYDNTSNTPGETGLEGGGG
jgi:hypothetical protein